MKSTLNQKKANSSISDRPLAQHQQQDASKENKTLQPKLRHLSELLPAAEASQFFYHSVLKFISLVLQVHNAK